MKTLTMIGLLLSAMLLGGCVSMVPEYEQPEAPIPSELPVTPATAEQPADDPPTSIPDLPWEEFFTDPDLQKVIALALEHNRDLRLAVLNIDRTRALYGVQKAELFPSINLRGTGLEQRSAEDLTVPGRDRVSSQYSVNLGITSWELDLFGRIRSLKEQALESYLATEEARRAAQIALISEIASRYLTLAADRQSLALAQSTLQTRQDALNLIQLRFDNDIANEIDLYRAKSQVDAAHLDVARQNQQIDQDINALDLLAGTPVPRDLLPTDLTAFQQPLRIEPGISSEVLLQRPDIIAAEHRLKGANAFVGAARAAFFPRISLTTALGTASDELSGLFGAGSDTWNFAPLISMPVFDPRTRAAYQVSKADQDIAVNRYEQAIQTAFREVADALAVRRHVDQQVQAQQAFVESAKNIKDLAQKRYAKGIDSYLGVLDAERSLYAAEQGGILLQLAKLANEVKLYAVLGGGGTSSQTPDAIGNE
jgi:multidrug efflux system outer membrane protein